MAPKLPVYPLYGMDISSVCRNWDQSADGTNYRMKNRGYIISMLARACNFCLGRMNRTVAWMSQHPDNVEPDGSDPLCKWTYQDGVTNARKQTWSLAYSVGGDAPAGDTYAERENDTTTQTQKTQQNVASKVIPADIQYATIEYSRGAVTDTRVTDGLSTYNGFTVHDLVVYEEPLFSLETSLHDACFAKGVAGHPALANFSDIRSLFHDVRTNNLPLVVSWQALASAGTFTTPASSSEYGIKVTSTSYVNVLDQSVSARDADSAGWPNHRQYTSKGSLSATQGERTPVQAVVYAKTTGGTSYVKFIGPDHVASNSVEIAITGTSEQMVVASSVFHLNPAAAWNDATTGCNKIDVHAKAASSQTLTIFGLYAWLTWDWP